MIVPVEKSDREVQQSGNVSYPYTSFIYNASHLTCCALTRSQCKRQDSRHLVALSLFFGAAFAARTRSGPRVEGKSSSSLRSLVAHSKRSMASASLMTVSSLAYCVSADCAANLAAGSSKRLSAQTLTTYLQRVVNMLRKYSYTVHGK